MSIKVVSAHSATDLIKLLAQRLATPQGDVLAPDIVVVPGQGMADWLQETLSPYMGGHGIVANVHFWHPSEFTLNATGLFRNNSNPWDPTSLQWTLFEYLSAKNSAGRSVAPGFSNARRKLSYARRVAELFDRYAVHRPEMILEWSKQRDSDGLNPLPAEFKWQPALWREVQSLLGESGPERAVRFSEKGAELHPLLSRGRISLFGLESFSRAKVEILRVLGADHDIELFHLTPVADAVMKMRTTEFVVRPLRRDLELSDMVHNPLLAAWSRSGLESAALVSSVATDIKFIEAATSPSVLGSLQQNLSADVVPSPTNDISSLLHQSDGSVQIHRCHGVTRQVEILRDALLHILKSDSSLSPRDILVLCPDLERFGSIIEPVMSARLGDESTRLRVAVVDRSTSTASPVAVAIDAILSLAGGRCSSLEVLEALSLDPIRRHFGFDDDELMQISAWITSLNVQWGLDSFHRNAWGYPDAFEEGSWRWALDRLTAGILVQSSDPIAIVPGIAAFDDVGGTVSETIGKLHQFHEKLSAIQQDAAQAHTLTEWASLIQVIADEFIEVSSDEAENLHDVRDVLAAMQSNAALAPTARFELAEAREFLLDAIPTIRGRAMKWGDLVRVGSPSRFRGVPAKVVAILGFDDDAFRGGRAGGDDILARDPWIGERDGRADERLGLLTTIHAASRHLVITCDGHDINDNSEIPMPVLLEELAEEVAHAIASIPVHNRSNRPLIISHSRQASDPVNLGAPVTDGAKNVNSFVDGSWTFDPAIASVARSAKRADGLGESDDGFGTPILPPPSADEAPKEFDVSQLVAALKRPTEIFVAQRLGVSLPADESVDDAEIPLWPNSLDYGGLGRELLDSRTAGHVTGDWWASRRLLGGLPLGPMGDAVVTRLDSEVEAILDSATPYIVNDPTPVELSLRISQNNADSTEPISVRGSLTVHDKVLLAANFSKWNDRLQLQPWVELAALTVQHPETAWRAVVIARNDEAASKKSGVAPAPTKTVEFQMRGESSDDRVSAARAVLQLAVRIRLLADRVPVPLFERSSWAHAKSKSKLQAELGYDLDRPAHRLVYGTASLLEMRAVPTIPDLDPLPSAVSRFDSYAELLTTTWDETVVVTSGATASHDEDDE